MNRRSLLALIAAVVLALVGAPAEAATTPLFAAHRGAQNVAGVPEQSLTAYRWAADNGATVFEVDLRWTADARMVLLHDATLDRTTNCTGPVSAIMYADLRKCASTDTVPNFYDLLNLARARDKTVLVELKADTNVTDTKAHEVVERINDYGWATRTVVYSFDKPPLDTMKRQPADAGIRYGLISRIGQAVTPAAARAVGTVYSPNWRDLTAAKVAAYKAAGVDPWVWASPDIYDRVAGYGVRVVIVNDVKGAAAWRAAR